MIPVEGAYLAAAAEAMHDQRVLHPELPPELARDWTLIEHITGRNALLGMQALGLGERVYYGFLARSKDDPTEFVAAIRGTERFLEWIEDSEAFLVGHVHAGFMSIFRTLECGMPAQSIADGISARVPLGSRVTVVGHSLGAPLAAYTLMGLRQMNVDARGVFFAMPRPGDEVFALSFDNIVGKDRYRVFNWLRDLVPRLPIWLPLHRFAPLGNRMTIRPADSAFDVPHGITGNDYLEAQHSCLNYAQLLANLKAMETVA